MLPRSAKMLQLSHLCGRTSSHGFKSSCNGSCAVTTHQYGEGSLSESVSTMGESCYQRRRSHLDRSSAQPPLPCRLGWHGPCSSSESGRVSLQLQCAAVPTVRAQRLNIVGEEHQLDLGFLLCSLGILIPTSTFRNTAIARELVRSLYK